MVRDFVKRMEMDVVSTYFQKREDHRVTFTSGGRSSQVDYILCSRCNLKDIGDCKEVTANDDICERGWTLRKERSISIVW